MLLCIKNQILKVNKMTEGTDKWTIDQWTKEQLQLAKKSIIYTDDQTIPIRTIGGFDISFIKDTDKACACFVILLDLKVIYCDFEMCEITEKYISGFLAFREVNPYVTLYRRFQTKNENEMIPVPIPDVCLVDGHGTFHHKQFGVACHLGVLLDIPTIGVGKTLLQINGLSRANTLRPTSNSKSMILPGVLAAAVWSNGTSNPIFVSPGHRVSLKQSIEIVQNCCLYRIPEPIRQADILSRQQLISKK